MRYILLFFFIVPSITFSQAPGIMIDTIGKTGRITFLGPVQTIQIGENAGSSISTGLNNIYIGNANGSNNTTGGNNLAIGVNAGLQNTIGSSNNNIGVLAGGLNQSGYGNVNIGESAGYTDATGFNNVRLGYQAGVFANGSYNVLIGNSAGYDLQSDNKLMIGNTYNEPPLIYGNFAEDSVIINGGLHVSGNIDGNLVSESIDAEQLPGILGTGYSAYFPEVMDNTGNIEIGGLLASKFLITKSVGFQIDTFTNHGGATGSYAGFTAEYPLVIETANAADTALLNNWFANPTLRAIDIIIKDTDGNEKLRCSLFDYKLTSISPGSDGRTSFTLTHQNPPDNMVLFQLGFLDFGSEPSYDPERDKLVEIPGVITQAIFTPAVSVDYTKKVITMEITHDEGEGLNAWITNFGVGVLDKKTVSIIETIAGSSLQEISRENFYEVIPFQYEIIYGFGLSTKVKARIKLFYDSNGPG